MITARRCIQNPLLVPEQVKPSRPEFQVDGIFNCGAVRFGEEILLLCRIAESVKEKNDGCVRIPVVKRTNEDKPGIEIVELNKREHPDYDFSDSRSIWKKCGESKKIQYLTSLSHFRVARSKDGIQFHLSDKPDLMPLPEEGWGMEDPRITPIGKEFYITYTAVSEYGAAASLIVTKDFQVFERKGILFGPENKDVVLFPEKINGMYYAMNRPVPLAIGTPDIWLAKSPDLIHWGEQKHFLGTGDAKDWYGGRIGGGAVPIRTEEGWLVIYHAADSSDRYCLGAMLLKLDDPQQILANLKTPILCPDEEYEQTGFFGNVVFTCGAVPDYDKDTLLIYYGAADDKICRADISIKELLNELKSRQICGGSPLMKSLQD